MPVYIRKGPLEIPAGSERDWASEDQEEGNFLSDPDQALDHLPQPYRMIGKTLNLLLDQTWEIISIRKLDREAEKLKAKITAYPPTAEIQITGSVNCMAAGGPGLYIFVGNSDGLAVYSLPDCTWICGWDAAEIEICSLNVCHLKNQTYFIATVDDMGAARLFHFSKDNLTFLKIINEPEDVSKRTISTRFEISAGGDFAASLLESSGVCWLEVYRLPKDCWLKELEHLQDILTTRVLPARQATPSQTPKSFETETAEISETAVTEPSVTEIKLTPPILLLKIKPPKLLTGSSFKSPLEAVQKSEGGSSVFGTGQNHIISTHQWEQQDAIFTSMFQKYIDVEIPETTEVEQSRHTLFHFLQPGKILQGGPERNQTALANAISVHWSGSHNLFLYLLVRTAKDKTDVEPKPDAVWPCAATILCSAVSSCAAYFAFGLEDGTLAVWDIKHSGFPLAVVVLPEERSIGSLHFIACLAVDKDHLLSNAVPATPRAQILVWCTDHSLYTVTAAGGKETTLVLLQERPENSEEQVSAVWPIPSLPNALLLFFRNGAVTLMDTASREPVCQFGLPLTHTLASPWQPVYSLDPDYCCLFLKGIRKTAAGETLATGNGACSLFAFSFDHLPLLESFMKKQQSAVCSWPHSSWEQRCEILLQKRLQTFSERRTQIAESWSLLRKHAAPLQHKENRNKGW